jgi:superfamily II DNA or RNA helicase
MGRAFNRAQRIALFSLAGGRCRECGKQIDDEFHADHVIPWSKEGATDVMNGRALCPTCNLKKGNKIMLSGVLQKIQIELRSWQERGKRSVLELFSRDQSSVLVSATMAAGKTSLGVAIAAELLKGNVRRVIVVTTSRNLQKSWIEWADKFGIDLLRTFDPKKGIPPDCHGVVITYARLCTYYQEQMTSFSEYLKGYATEAQTLVILDEPHHLSKSDESGWGENAKTAFEFARYRLLLTGTPWRSDRTAIPFVDYDDIPDVGKVVHTDFNYSYTDGLVDKIVRRVNFPLIDSATSFSRNKRVYSSEMLENVPKYLESDAVRTALDPEVSEWLPTAMREAHEELVEMRKADPRAAGLLVVSDTRDMDNIVAMVRTQTGCEPVVVHSNLTSTLSTETDTDKLIDDFRKSDAPWIIAVQMISEGVDIPRLRVGVYGTNIRTRLGFRQFVGRFLRVIGSRFYDYASVYVLRTGHMIEYVREFELEVYEALRKEADECICACGCYNGPNCRCGCQKEESIAGCNCGKRGPGDDSDFLPLSGSGDKRETVQSGLFYAEFEMEEAKELKKNIGRYQDWSLTDIAEVSRIHRTRTNNQTTSTAQPRPAQHTQTKERRREIQMNRLALAVRQAVLIKVKALKREEPASPRDYSRIHKRVNKMVGADSSHSMTEEQLTQATALVVERFEDLW